MMIVSTLLPAICTLAFVLLRCIHSASIPDTTFLQFPLSTEYDFDYPSIPFAQIPQNVEDYEKPLFEKRQILPIVDLTPEQNQISKAMAQGKPTSFNDTTLPPGEEKNAKLQAEKTAKMNPNSTITTQKPTSQCESLATRRPWSKATKEERQAYLNASTCVGFQPGSWNQRNFTSKLIRDDFVLYHAVMTNLLHFNAHLFPCHRLLVNTWFSLLQSKCNYTGDLLYMDFWTYADKGTLWTTDEIWSSDYYGKNVGIVQDGNEKDVMVHFINVKLYGVDIREVNRPIRRNLSERDPKTNQTYQDYMKTSYLNTVLQAKTYNQLRIRAESTFHAFLHKGVGGDMIKTHSVVDDFFWAVHTGLDAFWAFYQDQNDGANRFAFGGIRVLGSSEQATLHDTCTMLGIWSQDYNVLDLMDIRTKPNCFEYEYTTNFTLSSS